MSSYEVSVWMILQRRYCWTNYMEWNQRKLFICLCNYLPIEINVPNIWWIIWIAWYEETRICQLKCSICNMIHRLVSSYILLLWKKEKYNLIYTCYRTPLVFMALHLCLGLGTAIIKPLRLCVYINRYAIHTVGIRVIMRRKCNLWKCTKILAP